MEEKTQEKESFEEIANTIVQELNHYESDNTSVARTVGKIVHEYASKLNEAGQRKLVKTIKESKDLKLSPQFVYDCYRMFKKFPDMASASWSPMPNLSLSHYFEAARYKMSNGGMLAFITEASDLKYSIREMKDTISKDKASSLSVSEKETKELRGEMHSLINQINTSGLLLLKNEAVRILNIGYNIPKRSKKQDG